MSLTPLQERRLRQTEEQIAFLEKQVQTKGAGYIVRSALLFAMLFYVIDFFTGLIFEKRSLAQYITGYSWLQFLCNWAGWMVVQFFLVVMGNRSRLKQKNRELQQLKKKYGLMENDA